MFMGWANVNFWQTCAPRTKPRRGKILQAQECVRRNRVASGCCVRGKPVSITVGVSGACVRFNRQLHPDEKQVIKTLANGDADKEHRLEAAGCALVHCSAEYAPGTADYTNYSALEKEGAGYTAEQSQLQHYNGTLFAPASYGGMVRKIPGSSLFHYSSGDVQADNSALRAGMEAQRPGSIDYVTIQAGAGIGGSLTMNTHNGNVFAGGSISASREAGIGVVIGMIPANVGKSSEDKAELTDAFLGGQSVGGNACRYGVCVGLNHAVDGQTSIEGGVGIGGVTRAPNPGGNAGDGYSFPIFTIPGIGAANAKH